MHPTSHHIRAVGSEPDAASATAPGAAGRVPPAPDADPEERSATVAGTGRPRSLRSDLERDRDKAVRFGEFLLARADRSLWRGDARVPLAPKAYALLELLVRRAGCAVTKSEILAEVWPGTFVTDAVVKVCMRELRRALGDTALRPRWILTERTHGYRFIGELRPAPGLGRSDGGDGRVDLPRLVASVDHRPDSTLAQLVQAAEGAAARRDWVECTNHLGAACTAAGFLLSRDPAVHLELLSRRMDAARRAGLSAEFRADSARALALARESGDARAFARVVLAHAEAHQSVTVPSPDLVYLLRTALERLEPIVVDPAEVQPDTLDLCARLYARLAYALYADPRAADERKQCMERARALAGRSDARATHAYVIKYTLWTRRALDPPLVTLAAAERLCELSADEPHDEPRLHALGLCVVAALEAGDVRRFEATFERYVALAQASRQPWYVWSALRFRILRALLRGELEEAEQRIRESMAVAETFDHADAIGLFYAQTLILRIHQERYAEVASVLEGAQHVIAATPAWRALRIYARACMGDLDLAAGELDELAAQGFRTIAPDGFWTSAMLLLADACVLVGSRPVARTLYELLSPHAGRLAVAHSIACFGSIDRTLGGLALLLRRPVAARLHLEAACRMHERLGAERWLREGRAALASCVRAAQRDAPTRRR